jgi:CTD small phosphatase-like protein 2
MNDSKNNDDYIRKNLSKDYEESLQAHKLNYLSERENRIKKEQEEILRENERLQYEDELERERKNLLKKLQYNEYIQGIQKRENKLQKEFEEKLIPVEVSLPMNSDERLKNYHNRIYKLSDKADRNRKLFMEYNAKSKNDLFYNYLSKRYTSNNKEANKTIPFSKDLPITQRIKEEAINKTDEVNKNQYAQNQSMNTIQNYSYNKYKNLYKEYDDYNRSLIAKNLRKKEILNKEQELNRNSTLRSNKKKISLSLLKSKIKKIKTLTKESTITSEKKKSQNAYRKEMSDAIKSLDFERALKNKNNLAKTQYNLFSPDKFTNTEFCDSDYLEYTLDCMDLILKQNNFQKQQKNKVNFNFPKTRGNKLKKIALFDLDETLVHCTGDIKLNNDPYQHCINIVLPGNKETKVGINIRPFWKKTLNLIKRYYHIVVFTASHQAYADAVLDFMDPSNKFFKYRLYRNNCSLVDIEGSKFYVKDLDIFDEFYDLKDIIIIDNSVLSFIYHLENGIPIVPYYNEDKDGSLYVVGLYLIHIYKEDDLREANKKYINLDNFLNEARTRNDNIIKEEPFYNNCNERNNIEKKMDKSNGKGSNIKKQSNSDKEIKIGFGNRTNPRRCSFSIDSPQHKLMCQSKLINMYYNINYNKPLTDQTDEIIEEKSNKSFSVEVEEKEEQNNNESHKNISELFFQRRLLTTVDKPKIVKRSSKSNKDLYNYFNLKMIRSDFYNKFSEGTFPI